MAKKKVIFETVSGCGGVGHYLDDYRCGGGKSYGGGSVTYRAELCADDIVQALAARNHGKNALNKYAKRAAEAAKQGESDART